MRPYPRLFGLYAKPDGRLRIVLGLMPIVALVVLYLVASHARLQENPDDKLTPSISKMVESVHRIAFTPDKRTGKYTLLEDTVASLKRIGIGLGSAAVVGLLIGINLGLFPGFRALFETIDQVSLHCPSSCHLACLVYYLWSRRSRKDGLDFHRLNVSYNEGHLPSHGRNPEGAHSKSVDSGRLSVSSGLFRYPAADYP